MPSTELPLFGSSFATDASASEVLSLILSPEAIAHCLPDVRKFERIDSNSFLANVEAGTPMLKGSFSFKFRIKSEDSGAEIEGAGSGSGSTIEMKLNATLVSLSERQTRVDWHAEVKFSGAVAVLGKRILGSITSDYVSRIIICIQKALGNGRN